MKNSRARLFAFTVVVLSFALAFAWWMFHLPYNEAELYRAIPHNADMVSSHADLPSRLMQSAAAGDERSPFWPPAGELGKAMAGSGKLRKAFASPELRGKRSVVAYVRRPGGGNEPAWFFATWLGARGQLMRWSLLWKTPPNLVRVGTDSGYPIWASRPDASNGTVLSFAFVDGMIAGCVSRNPAGVRHALEAYDGHVPSVEAAKLPAYAAPLIPNPNAPDTGWFRSPARPLPGMPHIVAFSFDSIEYPCIRGAFQSDMPLAANTPMAAPADIAELPGQFAGALSAVLVMPSELLAGAMENAPDSMPRASASALIQSGAVAMSNSSIAAGLFLDEFGGRIQLPVGRPRIPALSIAARLGDRERVRQALTLAADIVNGAWRAGLIVTPAGMSPDNTPFFGFEMTSSNTAATPGTDDLPACAIAGTWLVLSSHSQSLQNLLSQPGAGAGPKAAGQIPEWQRLLREKAAGAFFWADLDATGKELDTLLIFAQMGAIPGMKGVSSREIEFARALIRKARTFKTGAAWIEIVNSRPRLHVEIGPAGAPADGGANSATAASNASRHHPL